MTSKTITVCSIFIISGGERRLHVKEGKEKNWKSIEFKRVHVKSWYLVKKREEEEDVFNDCINKRSGHKMPGTKPLYLHFTCTHKHLMTESAASETAPRGCIRSVDSHGDLIQLCCIMNTEQLWGL